MLFMPKTSSPARTALVYITVGTLTLVWTGIWYLYLLNHPPATDAVYYWVGGFTLTGLTLVVIGLTVGNIGRAARPAESPAAITPPVAPNSQAAVAPVAQAPVAGAPAQAIPLNAVPPAPAATNNTMATVGQTQR